MLKKQGAHRLLPTHHLRHIGRWFYLFHALILLLIVYPFLELVLGVLYLGPWSSPWVYWFTLLLMGVSTAGVARVLVKGQTLQCACLGTVFNLPMSTVTLVEDLLMVVMAAAMLLLG